MPEKIMYNLVQAHWPRVIKTAQSKVLNKSHLIYCSYIFYSLGNLQKVHFWSLSPPRPPTRRVPAVLKKLFDWPRSSPYPSILGLVTSFSSRFSCSYSSISSKRSKTSLCPPCPGWRRSATPWMDHLVVVWFFPWCNSPSSGSRVVSCPTREQRNKA